MSLFQEGTTRLGFKCDVKGCSNRATHTPIICIPSEGYSSMSKNTDRLFVFSHVCMEHRADARRYNYIQPKMRDLARARARTNRTKPDFDRWFIEWWPCVSDEYQRFLEGAGVVPPGDAQAEGSIILPGLGGRLH